MRKAADTEAEATPDRRTLTGTNRSPDTTTGRDLPGLAASPRDTTTSTTLIIITAASGLTGEAAPERGEGMMRERGQAPEREDTTEEGTNQGTLSSKLRAEVEDITRDKTLRKEEL